MLVRNNEGYLFVRCIGFLSSQAASCTQASTNLPLQNVEPDPYRHSEAITLLRTT